MKTPKIDIVPERGGSLSIHVNGKPWALADATSNGSRGKSYVLKQLVGTSGQRKPVLVTDAINPRRRHGVQFWNDKRAAILARASVKPLHERIAARVTDLVKAGHLRDPDIVLIDITREIAAREANAQRLAEEELQRWRAKALDALSPIARAQLGPMLTEITVTNILAAMKWAQEQ